MDEVRYCKMKCSKWRLNFFVPNKDRQWQLQVPFQKDRQVTMPIYFTIPSLPPVRFLRGCSTLEMMTVFAKIPSIGRDLISIWVVVT